MDLRRVLYRDDTATEAESKLLLRLVFADDFKVSTVTNFTLQVSKFFVLMLTLFLVDSDEYMNLWNAITLVNAFIITVGGKLEEKGVDERTYSGAPGACDAALFSLFYVWLFVFSLSTTSSVVDFNTKPLNAETCFAIAALLAALCRWVLLVYERGHGGNFCLPVSASKGKREVRYGENTYDNRGPFPGVSGGGVNSFYSRWEYYRDFLDSPNDIGQYGHFQGRSIRYFCCCSHYSGHLRSTL